MTSELPSTLTTSATHDIMNSELGANVTFLMKTMVHLQCTLVVAINVDHKRYRD